MRMKNTQYVKGFNTYVYTFPELSTVFKGLFGSPDKYLGSTYASCSSWCTFSRSFASELRFSSSSPGLLSAYTLPKCPEDSPIIFHLEVSIEKVGISCLFVCYNLFVCLFTICFYFYLFVPFFKKKCSFARVQVVVV
mmetsp:Transcript_25963/g.41941  ORF Transcript_25963/g.41941 Transcript_25963/m.41941 type:complete len:137 (+) Transcript_25963:1558-1968(+)